jgi:hypothetical protein
MSPHVVTPVAGPAQSAVDEGDLVELTQGGAIGEQPDATVRPATIVKPSTPRLWAGPVGSGASNAVTEETAEAAPEVRRAGRSPRPADGEHER